MIRLEGEKERNGLLLLLLKWSQIQCISSCHQHIVGIVARFYSMITVLIPPLNDEWLRKKKYKIQEVVLWNNQFRLKFNVNNSIFFLINPSSSSSSLLVSKNVCFFMKLYIDWMFTLSETVKLVEYDRDVSRERKLWVSDNNKKEVF